MGFERNYLIKIPSKQLNSSFFSTSSHEKAKLNPDPCTLPEGKRTGYFVSGLIDAEGSFSTSIAGIFDSAHLIFHGPSVLRKIGVIIPHFKEYPLLTQKGADLLLFEQIVELMAQGAHLTNEGLQQIIRPKS
jgi:hypothetical protein